jgi:hypothetical protein
MDEKTEIEKQPGLPLQLPILLGCLGFGFLWFALPIYRTNLHQNYSHMSVNETEFTITGAVLQINLFTVRFQLWLA